MTEVLIGQLVDQVPSKAQVLQVIGQASSADLGQHVVPKVEVPEGVGQRVGVQVRDEVASHGELADPMVGGHAVDGDQFGKV